MEAQPAPKDRARRPLVALALLLVVQVPLGLLIGYLLDSVRLGSPEKSNRSAASSADASTAPTATPESPTAAALTATYQLAANDEGTLLRAPVGTCRGGPRGPVEISTDRGRTFKTTLSPRAVLAVEAASPAELTVVAATRDCDLVTYRSIDGGTHWSRRQGSAGIWYLPSIPGALRIHAPAGTIFVACGMRAQLVTLSSPVSDVAFAGCSNGSVLATDDAGTVWKTRSRIAGLTQLAFRSPSIGYATAETRRCQSALYRTDDGGQGWRRVRCVADSAPTKGLAVSATDVYVQVASRIVRIH